MRVATFADLLDTHKLAAFVLDTALADDAPLSLARCRLPSSTHTPETLRNEVLKALPMALCTGIPEAILSWWLPRQLTPGPWPTDLTLVRRPVLESLDGGRVGIALRVHARLVLRQTGALIHLANDPDALSCGEDRAWHARLTIGLGDEASLSPPRHTFYARNMEVFLPKGPWPL